MVAEELVDQIIVYPDEGADFAAVASAIEVTVENSATVTGADDERMALVTEAVHADLAQPLPRHPSDPKLVQPSPVAS